MLLFLFQVFFLGGRFIFGPDVKSIFTTLFLVIAPVAVFCAFVARKFFDDFPNHSGYSILILVILLTTFVSHFYSYSYSKVKLYYQLSCFWLKVCLCPTLTHWIIYFFSNYYCCRCVGVMSVSVLHNLNPLG